MKFAGSFALLAALIMLGSVFSGCIGGKGPAETIPEPENISVEYSGGTLKLVSSLIEISSNLESGTFDFVWNSGQKITGAVAGAEVDGTWYYTSDYEERSWDKTAIKDAIGIGEKVSINFKSQGKPGLVQEITVYPETGYAVLRLRVMNEGNFGFKVTAMRPLDINPSYDSSLGFMIPEMTIVSLMNGYGAWDYAGAMRVMGTPMGQEYDFQGNVFSTSDTLSWWVGSIYDELSGTGYTAGALTANKWKTTVLYQATQEYAASWNVECGGQGECVAVAPGESVESELIYIGSSQSNLDQLEEYASLVDLEMNARHVFNPPVGWCSWYQYFDTITEDIILSNAKALSEINGVNYEYVLIDDGWQGLWGDWNPNEKFPNGMGYVASQIHSLGLKAGIWLAPFLVNQNLPIVSEHPDWFVKDASGNYITYGADDGSPHLGLDPTHPEVQQWIFDMFAKVKGWGYDYIKIDFLFAGNYEGIHYDNTKTGTEALLIGLDIIRQAMGNETYIDGCGAAMLPGVGIFDGNRVGGDIFYGSGSAAMMNWFQLIWECRNVAARYFMGGEFYHNDPDVIVVREPYTADEAKTLATACVLSGGVTLISENIPALSEERLALISNSEVFGLVGSGRSAIPLDIFERPDIIAPQVSMSGTDYRLTVDTIPQVWYLPLEDGSCAVGLFNWGTGPAVVNLDFAKIGMDVENCKLRDLWAGNDLGEKSGSYSTILMPHAVQLLKIEKI